MFFCVQFQVFRVRLLLACYSCSETEEYNLFIWKWNWKFSSGSCDIGCVFVCLFSYEVKLTCFPFFTSHPLFSRNQYHRESWLNNRGMKWSMSLTIMKWRKQKMMYIFGAECLAIRSPNLMTIMNMTQWLVSPHKWIFHVLWFCIVRLIYNYMSKILWNGSDMIFPFWLPLLGCGFFLLCCRKIEWQTPLLQKLGKERISKVSLGIDWALVVRSIDKLD